MRPNEPLRKLDGGDDRPQPTKFANGQIWTLIDTKLANGRAGLLWLAIQPTFARVSLSGVVTHQGYLGVATNNLAYGDIAVTPDGAKALVVASLVGPASTRPRCTRRFATDGQPTGAARVPGRCPPRGRPQLLRRLRSRATPIAVVAGVTTRWPTSARAACSGSRPNTSRRARGLPLANWGTAIGKLPS